MKTLFFAVLIFALSFVLPAYLSFIFALIFVVYGKHSVMWLLVFGLFLDVAYQQSLALGNFELPLYVTIALVLSVIIPRVSRFLNF